MPCEKCEEGKIRWGETGECIYETMEECQSANQEEYTEEVEDKKKEYAEVNYNFNFTESMMEELHMEGKLEVRIEREGEEDMVISFTYNKEEEIIEDKSNDEVIIAMLDEELDEYIDKLANSIKKL
jgi:hypothetical protein|tara:strand:- start:259 stop:636 length:378 start_codon:yes stop_codon:yes gene_type:complete